LEPRRRNAIDDARSCASGVMPWIASASSIAEIGSEAKSLLRAMQTVRHPWLEEPGPRLQRAFEDYRKRVPPPPSESSTVLVRFC
jgi:hypothetical protein